MRPLQNGTFFKGLFYNLFKKKHLAVRPEMLSCLKNPEMPKAFGVYGFVDRVYISFHLSNHEERGELKPCGSEAYVSI